MQNNGLERRDFHKLTLAALGGVLAGTLPGCNDSGSNSTSTPKATDGSKSVADVGASKKEMHLCHGLNSCKNQGVSGKNDCAGQGSCATVTHVCAGANACKGQGGCGANPGQNECKEKGGCSVPLMEDAWKKVRERLAADLKKSGKTLGADPKAKS